MKMFTMLTLMSLLLAGGTACSATPASLEKAVAITEVFGDGQQVTAVAVHYNVPMDGSKLSAADFSVTELTPSQLSQGGRNAESEYVRTERIIDKVYTNTVPEKGDGSRVGEWVILELVQIYHYMPSGGGGGNRNGGPQGGPGGPRNGNGGHRPGGGPGGPGGNGGHGGPGGNFRNAPLPGKEAILEAYKGITSIPEFKAEITQNETVVSAKGRKIDAPAEPVVSSETVNLVVDDFRQLEYNDEKTGIPMAYNLFVPKDYDPSNKYPLVLFMPDMTVAGKETTRTLTQGIGATVWASPEEQAKHPCFVLAPDYLTMIINDAWMTNEYMDATVNLLAALQKEYSIDADRLYTTGQSGGCMLSFAIGHYYPDLFAGYLLMAGKWDETRIDNLVGKKMWMMCGEGDIGAFPSMNRLTEELRNKGVQVSEAQWNGRSSAEEFARLCKELDQEDAPVRYTHFVKDSLFPDDEHLGGSEHLQSWRVTYTIEGARDWLFRQSK